MFVCVINVLKFTQDKLRKEFFLICDTGCNTLSFSFSYDFPEHDDVDKNKSAFGIYIRNFHSEKSHCRLPNGIFQFVRLARTCR